MPISVDRDRDGGMPELFGDVFEIFPVRDQPTGERVPGRMHVQPSETGLREQWEPELIPQPVLSHVRRFAPCSSNIPGKQNVGRSPIGRSGFEILNLDPFA